MVTQTPFGSTSFRLVARGLIALHQQLKEGKDDSPEAATIRDDLDAPLKALDQFEKERSQWLSEDLYSVSEPTDDNSPKVMNEQAQLRFNDAFEARQDQEWDRALSLLRQLREYISPALLSYLRASIWLEAGYPEIANVFYRHASERDPANANYHARYLRALAESEPTAAD